MPKTPTRKYMPVAKISPTGELLAIFRSARQAALFNYMSDQTVINYCNGKMLRDFAPDGNKYVWDKDLEYTRIFNNWNEYPKIQPPSHKRYLVTDGKSNIEADHAVRFKDNKNIGYKWKDRRGRILEGITHWKTLE